MDTKLEDEVTPLAKVLSVTSGHLSEISKALTGATVRELVAQRSLWDAKRLLVHLEMRIS